MTLQMRVQAGCSNSIDRYSGNPCSAIDSFPPLQPPYQYNYPAGTTGVSGSCVRGEWTAGWASRPRWCCAAGVCAPRLPGGLRGECGSPGLGQVLPQLKLSFRGFSFPCPPPHDFSWLCFFTLKGFDTVTEECSGSHHLYTGWEEGRSGLRKVGCGVGGRRGRG